MDVAYLGDKKMAEIKKPAPETPEVKFMPTKMTNVSKQTLYLSSGILEPGETTKYSAAEYSTLHMFLKVE